MGSMAKFLRVVMAGVLAFGLAPSCAFADEAGSTPAGSTSAVASEAAASEAAAIGEPAAALPAADAASDGAVTVTAPDGSGMKDGALAQSDLPASSGPEAPSAARAQAPSAAAAEAEEAASEASPRESYYVDGDWGYYVVDENSSHPYTVQVTDYFGSSADIVVPEEFGGIPVTEITFLLAEQDLSFVRSISLPSTLKEICNFAFEGMTGLQSVTLPANSQLERVGEYAFNYTDLRSFVMPASLKTVGGNAFQSCRNLASIQFNDIVEPFITHNSVMSGEDLFEYDSAYAIAPYAGSVEYRVPATSQNFKAIDGVLYSKDGSVLYACSEGHAGASFTVPGTVREIAEYAFYGLTEMKEVVLPEGLTTIHEYAFAESGIRSFEIPDSVTTVYGSICQGCADLERVVVGDGVKELGTCAGWQDFYGCSSLREVELGSSVEVIGNSCFAETALTSVHLPANVRQLNFGAFGNNYGLVEVTGGEGLREINRWAFCQSGLTSFPFGDNLTFVSGEAFSGSPSFDGRYPSYLSKDGQGDYRAVGAKVVVEGTDLYSYAYQVLDLVNQERAKAGLSALSMDRELLEAAMQRAAEISLFFDHTRPDGQTCFSVSDKAYAENIAIGQFSPEHVMNSWMNSDGHRGNILTASRQSIGVGCYSVNGVLCWVQLFGDAAAQSVSLPADTMTARTVGISQDVCDLNVSLTPGPSMGIEQDGGQFKLALGDRASLSVKASTAYTAPTLSAESFVWNSSDPGVVSVGSDGSLVGVGMGSAQVTATAGFLQASATVSVGNAAPLYSDTAGHWAESVINEVTRMGLMGGYGDGRFDPDGNVTRAQVATVLYRYTVDDSSDTSDPSKYPADTTGFADAGDYLWYTAALNWAKEAGILLGYDNMVRPDDPVSRAELATIIGRYAESHGAPVMAADRTAFDGMTDAALFDAYGVGYAEPFFVWACDEGILSGVPNDDGTASLLPLNTATRGEMAKILVLTVQTIEGTA